MNCFFATHLVVAHEMTRKNVSYFDDSSKFHISTKILSKAASVHKL